REGRRVRAVAAVTGQYRDRGRTAVAAGSHPWLRTGEGEGGAGSKGALRPARSRSRQPAVRAEAAGGGVGARLSRRPGEGRDPLPAISVLRSWSGRFGQPQTPVVMEPGVRRDTAIVQ